MYFRPKFNELIFAYANPGRLNRCEINVITTQINFTDWMFLYFLASNLRPFIFRSVLAKLVDEFQYDAHHEHDKHSSDVDSELADESFPLNHKPKSMD